MEVKTQAANANDVAGASTAASQATAGSTPGKVFSPTLTTFSKLLAGGLDFLTLQSTDRTLTLSTPSLGFGGPIRANATLALIQPSVSTAALNTIADTTKRAAAQTALTNELSDFDDWRLTVPVAIGPDRSAIVSNLLAAQRAGSQSRLQLILKLQAAVSGIAGDTTIADAQKADTKYLEKLTAQADAQVALVEGDRAATEAVRTPLATLLANDSLFVGDLSYEGRSSLVGPDQGSISAGYQYGAWTLTDFLNEAGNRDCGLIKEKAADLRRCLDSFTAWETDHHGSIARAFRIAATVQYVWSQAYNVNRPDYGMTLSLPSSHSIIWSLKAGVSVGSGGAQAPVRCDVGATYEDNSNDAAKHDRLVGTATLAIRLSDTLQVPLGLVYANHAQYVGDVDKHWGAHFGITFRK